MPVTKTWNVDHMDVHKTYDGKPNVVYTVYWSLDAMDEAGRTSRAYGSVDLKLSPGAPFTPFENLTKQQVLGWVHGALGASQKTLTEDFVDKRIADQIDPPTTSRKPPWLA